jgi:hypothetical protein
MVSRLDRLDKASKSVQASMEQQHAMYQAEQARLADDTQRRRRRADAENEIQSQEVELTSTEALVTQQLAEIARHHRVEDAARELRQSVRADLQKHDREDEALRHSQRVEDESDRARAHMEMERYLETHQWELADFRRREVGMQLNLYDQVRRLQLGGAARERSVRAAARAAQVEGAARQQALRQQLAEDARRQAEDQKKELERERQRQDRCLRRLRRKVEEERARSCQSLEQQTTRLHDLDLEEERGQFELRLQQALFASEAAMRKSEVALQRKLAAMEDIRLVSERGESLDAQRRELLERRALQRQHARRTASEMLGQERRQFGASLEADIPIDAPLSEMTSEAESEANSEDSCRWETLQRSPALASESSPASSSLPSSQSSGALAYTLR